MSDLRAIGLTCRRCGEQRDIAPRVEEERGEFGSLLSSWLAYTVTPPCAGWVTHDGYMDAHPERFIDSHEATEGDNAACGACREYEDLAYCPFDGGDDYQSGEEQSVYAVLADRKRYGRAS